MSRKYISQIDNKDFVFPNKTVKEYDLEIIHNINDNCVNGSISNFSGTTVSGNLVVSFDYIWDLGAAEPYIRNSNVLSILTLHAMGANENHYKPFKTISGITSSNLTLTYVESGVTPGFARPSFTITPASLGIPSLSNGIYYFEIRFIGQRCVYPVCFAFNYAAPTPTPTPTSTPTPTPTVTPTPTPTPTVTVIDYFYYAIKKYDCENECEYVSPDLVGRSTTSLSTIDGMYRKIGSFVYQVQTLITPDPMSFDIDLDSATFTDLDCTTACAGVTPTPTPTPSGECDCYEYDVIIDDLDTNAATGNTGPNAIYNGNVVINYTDCEGNLTESLSGSPGAVVCADNNFGVSLTFFRDNLENLAIYSSVSQSARECCPVTLFDDCGRGNTAGEACSDATANSRTFYSNCSTIGIGCTVYTDNIGTLLTGYTHIFMGGANWDINSSTGVITASSSIQC